MIVSLKLPITVLGTGFAEAMLMILIVEDEQISRKALTKLLSSRGFDITAVSSAEEAIDVLDHNGSPEIALVDLNLPGMDGLCFLQHLAETHPEVPAVLMTATGSDGVYVRILHDGMKCSYVRKPVDFPKLLTLIDHHRHIPAQPMQAHA